MSLTGVPAASRSCVRATMCSGGVSSTKRTRGSIDAGYATGRAMAILRPGFYAKERRRDTLRARRCEDATEQDQAAVARGPLRHDGLAVDLQRFHRRGDGAAGVRR